MDGDPRRRGVRRPAGPVLLVPAGAVNAEFSCPGLMARRGGMEHETDCAIRAARSDAGAIRKALTDAGYPPAECARLLRRLPASGGACNLRGADS